MKLFRSFSFRLAAIYVLLFSASLAVLLGTYQFVSITGPKKAVQDALRVESDAFAATYRGDPHRLATLLERRAGAPTPRAGFHLLADPRGRVISTNLPSWPAYAGAIWHSIEADIYRDGDEDDHEALALDRRLADGSRLLIGRDVEELDDLEEAIASAARYLIAATLVLATLGALLMNHVIGRRLEAVSKAARTVIAGDLSGRVKIGGSGDDFDRLAATLNLMLDRVEAGVEAVRTVSDSVAHELRTPLTRLQASLRELEQSSSGGQALSYALVEADRLQTIFDSVLRISRIESGRHGARFERVDLSLLLGDAAELYGPSAEARDIKLTCDIASDLTAIGDRDLLFQAVSNLIDNAIKFTPPRGTVRIAARQAAGRIGLEIEDSGPGIPDDLKDLVGQRFLRAPSSESVPGFGLGLAVVKAVARLHDSNLLFRDADPGLIVEWRLTQAA